MSHCAYCGRPLGDLEGFPPPFVCSQCNRAATGCPGLFAAVLIVVALAYFLAQLARSFLG